jgi:hypothetical protein
MGQVFIEENKYNGSYVAIKDFGDSTVIADGKDPKEVYDKAVKQGYSNPVIVFIPAKDTVQIY